MEPRGSASGRRVRNWVCPGTVQDSLGNHEAASLRKRPPLRRAELATTARRPGCSSIPHASKGFRRQGCGRGAAVLVVGMMRSGTSLVEQILASHASVTVAELASESTHCADASGKGAATLGQRAQHFARIFGSTGGRSTRRVRSHRQDATEFPLARVRSCALPRGARSR